MPSLLKITIQIYIWIGVFLFAVLIPYCDGTIHYYNLINVLLFLSYAIVMWCTMGREEHYYTYGRLASTVFLYSIVFVGLYLQMSYFYTDDTFYWDYTDPYVYYGIDVKLIDNEVPFFEQPEWIERYKGWDFSDWGASISQTLFLKIIPSRYFLFFIQTIVGVAGAAMLFGIGKKIMRIDYAYIAALSYSISSYCIFYYASFRKEVFMVFIVIASFWSFYQYMSSRNKMYLWLFIIITALLLFFRPEIIGLMLMGVASYYIGKRINKKNAPYIIILFVVAIGLSLSVIISMMNSLSEDVAKSENFAHASSFTVVVSSVGALIGPFPQMLQLGQDDMSQLPLYGPGLLLKFILLLAFWNGFVESLKNLEATVFPLFFFTILEMVALAVWIDGLELRKAMPHICTFYIAAFWFISKYDKRVTEEGHLSGLYPLKKVKPEILLFGLAMLVFFSTFVWNTMRI